VIERAERRGKSTLSDAIQVWLRQAGLTGAMGERRVLSAWTREAGNIARRARAVRFERGVLTVEVSSSAQLHELSSFTGEGLRKAANRALGSDRIDRIAYKLKS
jgi:predicted nucleic acid-binding Zn ribbon protein